MRAGHACGEADFHRAHLAPRAFDMRIAAGCDAAGRQDTIDLCIDVEIGKQGRQSSGLYPCRGRIGWSTQIGLERDVPDGEDQDPA